MSRSKKYPSHTITKQWDTYRERRFRRRIKAACHDVEIDFDPDADFLDLTMNNKKLGDYGTRIGFNGKPPDSADTYWRVGYIESQRK